MILPFSNPYENVHPNQFGLESWGENGVALSNLSIDFLAVEAFEKNILFFFFWRVVMRLNLTYARWWL